MIDLYSIQEGIPFISAFFIGHYNEAIIVKICGGSQNKSDYAADRHMTVVISLFIHVKELRINGPFDKQSWYSYLIADYLVEIIIFTEGGGIKRDI